jgi:hypothetical protein
MKKEVVHELKLGQAEEAGLDKKGEGLIKSRIRIGEMIARINGLVIKKPDSRERFRQGV